MSKPHKAIHLDLLEQPKKRSLPQTFPGCWEDSEWLRSYYREYRRGNTSIKKSAQKYKNKNREKLREDGREYYKENTKKCSEANKKWASKNKTRVKYLRKKWRNKNTERARAREREWYNKNPEKVKAKRKRGYVKNRSTHLANAAKGRARKFGATPKWVNNNDLKLIYSRRDEITKETGVRHVVDHIVPLKGDVVCGLHVPWNLRIIPEAENIRKLNKFFEDMGLHPTVTNGLIHKEIET